MGITDMILSWILRNVRVDRETLIRIVDRIDADSDGYVDVGELMDAIRGVWEHVKAH